MIQEIAVSVSDDVYAPLPIQGKQSLELHSAIVSHLCKKSSKAEFMRRKERRRQDRKQKRGADYKDKQEFRNKQQKKK
jgi:hypothetical protein